ncbi:MAG TPA: CehA/McbA family metallohydrolase [Bryobacteraceae bacterium]|nr:CehA/McbA family metallohydrolase [Bryobacteraceae bacterium]
MKCEHVAGIRGRRVRATVAVLGFVWCMPANGAKRGSFAAGYMYSYYVPSTAGTPWRPCWSPDGKELAFSMSGSIWKIAAGGTVAQELTANASYDSSPAWSPSGRWITYTAEDSQGVNLMLLNVATGESSRLTSGNNLNLDPAWSPDGRKIAFVRSEPRGRFHISYLPFDEGRAGSMVRLTSDNDFGRARLYFNRFDDHIQPAWSPDGKELMLVSNRGIPLGSGALYRMPVQPDGMSKASMILREETLYRTRPQWSRDGKRVFYSSHRGSQYNNLYVLPASGGEPYQLTFGEWDHLDPALSPDNERIAYISNRRGYSELRLLRTYGGEDIPVRIDRRVYRRPMGKLEVQLRDGDKPAAARVYLVAADGKTYAPEHAYQRMSSRSERGDFFYASGGFVVDVPPGKIRVEAVRGNEFQPAVQEAEIRAGALTEVRLAPKRIVHPNASGWYSGNDHIHMNYGGNLRNTPENLMMMAGAEWLNVTGAKIANKDHRIFDRQYYTPGVHKLSTRDHLLSFGQEYRPPFHGHLNFINLTRHLISPFITGYEGSGVESLYPSNTDVFQVASKQGAIGGYAHPWMEDPEGNDWMAVVAHGGNVAARAFPVDLALGSFAYLEVLTRSALFTHTAPVWHRALNCGFKVTASAGEDSILNLNATAVMATTRVYAYLGAGLSWNAWVEAIRAGRTFVTNGPLLQFEVNGQIAGGEIHLPEAGGNVNVIAQLETAVPVDQLEMFWNGRPIETVAVGRDARSLRLEKILPVKESGWLTLRARGAASHPIEEEYIVAETSPVYVYAGNRPIRSKADAEYFIRWIDGIAKHAQGHTGWRSDEERKHVMAQFAEARAIFAQRAREAAR